MRSRTLWLAARARDGLLLLAALGWLVAELVVTHGPTRIQGFVDVRHVWDGPRFRSDATIFLIIVIAVAIGGWQLWRAGRSTRRRRWQNLAAAAIVGVVVWAAAITALLAVWGVLDSSGYIPFDELPSLPRYGLLLLWLVAGVLIGVAALTTVVTLSTAVRAEVKDAERSSVAHAVGTVAFAAAGALVCAVVAVVGAKPAGVVGAAVTAAELPAPTSAAPVLDFTRIALARHFGGPDSIGVTAYGLYTTHVGRLTGVEPGTGATRWYVRRPALQPEVSTADGGRVLVVRWRNAYCANDSCAESRVHAYAADTGRELWSRDIGKVPDRNLGWSEYPDSSQPSPDRLTRNNPRTGEPMWTVHAQALGCAPDRVVFGKLVWTVRAGAVQFGCATSNAADVYEPRIVGALDPESGQLLWTRTSVPNEQLALPNVPDDPTDPVATVLRTGAGSGTKTRNLDILDARTGQPLGTQNLGDDTGPEAPRAYPLARGYQLTVTGNTAHLIGPDGRELWTAPMPAPLQISGTSGKAGPAWISGNALLVTVGTADRNWIIAYDLADGRSTVLAGAGLTAAGDRPLIDIPVGTTLITQPDPPPFIVAHLSIAPWGILASGNSCHLLIPAR
ncbi:PQQ-binding-like beta-propeller repeat protein [Nocardia asiatica]|uniref:outer membrane protein assembly factor BamB family protein n=1 Tax=Nocardia asiatica TaxID=209252 RepID=UPI002453C982|nr:PQQ-binding-like beta-propeller repeat protein [Nocardia asiatica]